MNFQDLVSISGLPGLFQLLATKSDGAIVKNIEEDVTKFVAARSHSVTALHGIEVFTTGDNVRLLNVFLRMKENSTADKDFDISKADNKAIKEHFGKRFPEYDKEKVYTSDMKKMLKWFAILDAKGLIVAPAAEGETKTAATSKQEEPKVEAPKESKAKKVAKEEVLEAKEEKEAKPKAAVVEGEEKPKKPRAKKVVTETQENKLF